MVPFASLGTGHGTVWFLFTFYINYGCFIFCHFRDKRHIGGKSQFFIPSAFDVSVRESPSDYCHMFGLEKLEWCGYPMVKNFEGEGKL